jgi:hypothetical protein
MNKKILVLVPFIISNLFSNDNNINMIHKDKNLINNIVAINTSIKTKKIRLKDLEKLKIESESKIETLNNMLKYLQVEIQGLIALKEQYENNNSKVFEEFTNRYIYSHFLDNGKIENMKISKNTSLTKLFVEFDINTTDTKKGVSSTITKHIKNIYDIPNNSLAPFIKAYTANDYLIIEIPKKDF